MLRLLLVFLLSSTLALGLPKPGAKIIGGEQVSVSDYSHQASIQLHGKHVCGGTIIGGKFILTAASCLDIYKEENFSVRAGTSFREEGGLVNEVKRIIKHPSYNSENADFNIALLELKRPFPLGSVVFNSVKLAEVEPDVDRVAVVSGWGTVEESGVSIPHELKAVLVKVVDRKTCQRDYDVYGKDITQTMICAGMPAGNADACLGDSGGPLVSIGSFEEQFLVGVVSWGVGCGRPNTPGVYTNVAKFRQWIKENSGI